MSKDELMACLEKKRVSQNARQRSYYLRRRVKDPEFFRAKCVTDAADAKAKYEADPVFREAVRARERARHATNGALTSIRFLFMEAV